MLPLRIPNGLNFFKQLLISFTFFFLPLYLFDLGFDGLQIGILMSIFNIVNLFSSFPIGIINDKLSIKYVIIFGMLLESLFFAGLYLYTDFLLIIPFFIAGGLGGNMIDTSIRSLTFKALGPGGRGRKLGIYQLASTGGFGIGIVLGGFMLASLDFSGVMLITSAAFLLLALVSYIITESRIGRFPLREYRSIILRRSTAIFLLPLFLFGIHWGAEHTSYSLFLREGLGLDLGGIGIYMGIPVMVLAVVSMIAGSRIDKTGNNKVFFFAGLVISGIGHIMMAYPVVPVSFMFRVLHEIGDAMAAVGYNVSFSKIFKVERVAGETSIAYTVMIMGAVFGSLVFGPLGFAYGFSYPLIISGALSLLSFAILFSFRNRVHF
ncbi:MAG: MFS transporter [Candidatus Aenigmarchaeota archaeon]|nr:MFS transporter [Candidatus Aenigmarchaeota archaeon]